MNMFKFFKKHRINSLGDLLRYIIAVLVYNKNWTWLKFIISTICEIEVKLPLIFKKDFYWNLQIADNLYPKQKEKETFAQRIIPKNTFYCEDCPFRTVSRVAKFLYGKQSFGYCLYLARGDFSFIKPTVLLWDSCKECGINEDIEDSNWEEINE